MTFFLSRIYKDATNVDSKIINFAQNIDANSLKGSKGGAKYRKTK
ncbi:MAG: hypothetical protein BAJALOKI1v1_620002 [Promethearchaeota archaeon]|nr:MAG: hypothetical protein BAJALOKI1v1_620002 [Candidatus Lokiarchaeota archaeon]